MMHEELFPGPELLIGQPGKEVVRTLVHENPRIKNFTLVRYTPGTTSFDEPDLIWCYDKEFREFTGAGFDHIVDLEPYFNTEVGLISLVEVFREPDPRPNVIDLRREYAHIPMIDFSLPGVDRREVIARIRSFVARQWSGFIVDSGNGSFHFYGRGLLSLAEYPKFVGDLRYDAERGGIVNLEFARRAFEPNYFGGECYTTLRLSPSHQHPTMPTVIDVV